MRIRCVDGRLMRHDPQPDDPYLETDIGTCPGCEECQPKLLSQYDRGKRCGEDLIGTCDNIEQHLQEGDNFENIDFYHGIDEVAFECNECGWWCEIGEVTAGHNDDDVCQDCAPAPED